MPMGRRKRRNVGCQSVTQTILPSELLQMLEACLYGVDEFDSRVAAAHLDAAIEAFCVHQQLVREELSAQSAL